MTMTPKERLALAEADIRTSQALQDIARGLDEVLKDVAGADMGFCLVVFNAVDEGRTSYVSNCNREDVAGALKELLGQWESGLPDIPAHKVN